MKRVYIAHPLRGATWRENIEKAGRYCRKYAEAGEVVPVSPLHAFGFLDPHTFDPEMGMAFCFSLLETCDELWVHGAWETSEGCQKEIIFAWEKGIKVRFVTDEVPA